MPIVAICNWLRRGTVKSVNHAMNLQDLFRQLFNHPRTLEDLGITEERSKQIMSATIDAWKESLQNPFALACALSAQINAADARERERGVFIRINSQESPFVCVSAGGLAVLLLPSSFACVRA